MAHNMIGNPPFPPLICFDEKRDFSLDDLQRISGQRMGGVSLCIRYPEGAEKRGGYFFHFERHANEAGAFVVYDFERRPVASFSAQSLVRFINHCTGRRFDEPSFVLCQTELNFLKDEEPDA